MQVMLMRLMSKGEYVIVPKGTKFKGSGKLGLMLGAGVIMKHMRNTKFAMNKVHVTVACKTPPHTKSTVFY